MDAGRPGAVGATAGELDGGRRPRTGWWWALAAIAAVAVAVRVWYVLAVVPDGAVRFDPALYHHLGTNLADGLGFVRPPQMNLGMPAVPTAEFGVGFPALVAAAARLGLRSHEQQALVTCVVGGGSVALLGMLGRRLAGGAVGLVAASLLAVHPLLFQLDGLLLSESLYLALLLGLLVLVHDALGSGRLLRWAAVGVVAGAAVLTRSDAAVLVPLLVLPAALLGGGRTRRDRWSAAGVALVGVAALVLPWSARNLATFERFVPLSSNLGSVALGANCDDTYSGRQLGSWSFGCVAAFAGSSPDHRVVPGGDDESVVYGRWREEGLAYALDHTDRWPAVATARLARAWGLYWHPTQQLDHDVSEGRDRTLQTLGYGLHLVLLPLAGAGAVVAVRQRRRAWLVLAPTVAASVVVPLATYGITRIRVVAEPALLLAASLAVVTIVRGLRRSGQGQTEVDEAIAQRGRGGPPLDRSSQ